MNKIKLANKRYKREQKRRAKRDLIASQRQARKIQRQRTRKMMIEGRRETIRARRENLDYVKNLEAELESEAA